MATNEKNVLMRNTDSSGNSTLLYPITKVDNVDGLDEAIASKAEVSHKHSISDVTDLQTNLNSKQATITGSATTITSSNLTASRVLVSNSSGKVAVSDVTSTELGYLDGATSNIQSQLNNKTQVQFITWGDDD